MAIQPVGFEGELRKIARVRGVTAASRRSRSSTQPSIVKVFGTITGVAPDTPMAATKFGHAGVGTMTSSPFPGHHAHADLHRMHAGLGDEEALGRDLVPEQGRMIARKCFSQLREFRAARCRTSRRPRSERGGRLGDEGRRREVALPGPERDHALPGHGRSS